MISSKHILALIAFIGLTLFMGTIAFKGSVSSFTDKAANEQDTILSPNLTSEEEYELKASLNQSLQWFFRWQAHSFSCQADSSIKMINSYDDYARLIGQEIKLTLTLTDKHIRACFEELHLLIDFRRLRNNRLSVASLQTFCEDTYDKYLVSQKHINEQTQHIEEQVKKDAQSDLRLKEALEKKETSKLDVDSREQTYYRTFRVPNLDETSTEERPDKKDVRKSLEDQIIRLTKEQIKNIFCDDKKEFMITVPKFNLGDPQVFVLIESIALGSQAIETISFDREENGHYVVYPVKMLELPDEVTVLRDKILKNRMLEQKVQCK